MIKLAWLISFFVISAFGGEKFSHRKHQGALRRASLSCVDCHDFSLKSKETDPLGNPVRAGHLKVSKERCEECHFSNPDMAQIPKCLTCHQKESQKGAHVDNGETSCFSCHLVVSTRHRDLRSPVQAENCLKCHKTQRPEHRKVEMLSHSQRAQKVKLENGQLTCLTCHQIHLGKIKPVMNFCASCHGKKTKTLFDEFHKRVSGK